MYLYLDNSVLCGELEDLKVMVECFVEVCRRGLKSNANNSKGMVLGGEEGLKCEIHVDGTQLEQVRV